MPTKVKLKLDCIPLDEMIYALKRAVADAQEEQKYKRTPKTKRQNKKTIEFFGNCLYYMEELKKLKQHETDIKNQ
ncbi:hypothetical protein GGR32_000163 [Mesonia hippocampi]|uniref:Uncharacterized protein n=1 Tax=Mesonia hippocampi TaxID=1628250 RepID=A0A840ELB8_9FLAO|nr:hypothetical protein [Mesonia hippocampi]MBB4117891.1 hypothetical protein [Mesonia hippocampi]